MKAINDIIDELTDSDKSVTSPLLKTKVLASRIKNKELLEWVNDQLNGYDTNKKLPFYRQCEGNISGTVIKRGIQFNDQPLLTSGLPDDVQEAFCSINFYQSVEALESLKSKNASAKLGLVISAEHTVMLEKSIRKMGNPYYQIISAKKWTSSNVVTQILSIIRSKLLDFMLKIEEEFGEITEIETLKENSERISTIMYQTIINTGDGNILNTGENAKIKADIRIRKGDKKSLAETLGDNGINGQDISSLLEIIDREEPNKEKGTFGIEVNTWIKNMLSKALDGSWQISIGAAGGVLADAIQSYYGIV